MGLEKMQKVRANSEIKSCPLCGNTGELWRFANEDDINSYFVACTNQSDEQIYNEGDCPLSDPHEKYYWRPTKREAIKYWNDTRINLEWDIEY